MATHNSPLTLVVRGVLAAAMGTAAMDATMYAEYRLAGGTEAFLAWETSSGLDSWDKAPAPAQVGRRLYRRIARRELPPSAARLTSNVMHWSYGSLQGAFLGLTTWSVARRRVLIGPCFGAAVWTSSYAVLGAMGLYKPVWQYPPGVLGKDLANHLIYGTVAGCTLSALTRG